MAYSEAKLKSNCDEASPCFTPFLKENMLHVLAKMSALNMHYTHKFTRLFTQKGLCKNVFLSVETRLYTCLFLNEII